VVAGMGFGAFATYMIIPENDPKFVKVPETSREIKYCLAEPLGCIVNIVKEASCKFHVRFEDATKAFELLEHAPADYIKGVVVFD
jgi:threonine dehydrogenase-like Zn-dependent dehydrogenase